jgi:ribosome biogenesis GTPase
MTLEQLGWNDALEQAFTTHRAAGLIPARVAAEDKHHFRIWTSDAELTARVSGRLLHEARGDAARLPKVGDWTAVKPLPGEPKAVIHAILPRRTKLSRKLAGREAGEQILATNMDTAFIVAAADASFHPARLERMLVMVHESGARPVVVLNKIDLCSDLPARLAEAQRVAGGATVLPVCALSGRGVDQLAAQIQPGQTVVFIGTSGVGKSSLINRLYGEDIQATVEVREHDAKGRHTTTWREMIFLPSGGIVIDTPGMREFHIWLAGEGLPEAFPDIEALARHCRFRDCTHTHEKQCAVQTALTEGTLTRKRYESFLKLQRELAYLQEAQEQRTWHSRQRGARVAHRVFNKGGGPPGPK